MRGVEELDVFGRAHELTLQLYKATGNFPKEELYALTSQIKRAASSICANLMEGSHRLGTKEFRQFVGIANGSARRLIRFVTDRPCHDRRYAIDAAKIKTDLEGIILAGGSGTRLYPVTQQINKSINKCYPYMISP